MSQSLIYITASSKAEAMKLARALVEARLIACANILDGITSLYWWDGKVAEDQEVVVVCKTRTDLVDAVIARVKESHSYSCPCVVAVPITAGNPDYLTWIETETVSLPR